MKSGWNENKSIYLIQLKQRNNEFRLSREMFKDIPENVFHSLVAANTSLKYTQSNNIAIAYDGQVIGIGAGQQNRVECVELAGQKADVWILRTHPLFSCATFPKKTSRSMKINVITNIIKGWNGPTRTLLKSLSSQEKKEYCKNFAAKKQPVMVSDGFFPFPDNIDVAHAHNISAIMQPGGSSRDRLIIDACNKHGIPMVMSGQRLFLH